MNFNLHYVVILLLIMPAIADIQTSNTYYIEGATVREDVRLKNIEYANVVDISPREILSSAQGIPTTAKYSQIYDSIAITAIHESLGAMLAISGENPAYAKSMSAGDMNEIKFNYGLDSGAEQAYFYNGMTSVNENLLSKNNPYRASFCVNSQSLKLDASGSRFSFEDEDSSFYYGLMLNHGGSWAGIDANLTANKIDKTDATPVIYMWNSSVESSGSDYAQSHFNMAFLAGDRKISAMIRGLSSNGLEPTVPMNGRPWEVDPIPNGKGKTGVETIEDMIKLIQQGITNSGKIGWLIEN
jgi:hypothetical protein